MSIYSMYINFDNLYMINYGHDYSWVMVIYLQVLCNTYKCKNILNPS